MKHAKVIGLTILVVVIIIVVLQNTQEVETKLLFVKVSMPRAVLLLITLLVGFVLGLVAAGRLRSTPSK